MKLYNKIIVMPGLFMLLLSTTNSSNAQKTTRLALAGPKGIWVICGDVLPKNFSYAISRQKSNGDCPWVKVANTQMPASKEDLQANILNTEKVSGMDIAPLDAGALQSVWQRVTNNVVTNSPPEMLNDLVLRAATGTAWYDAAADSATAYRYKIEIAGNASPKVEDFTNIIKYPISKFATDIRPAVITPSLGGIYGEFKVVDSGQLYKCRILRSYYLHSGFEVIDAKPIFIRRKGSVFISFIDNTAVQKVPYSYSVQPIDAAGNSGFASPEMKAFDVAEKSIAPSVYGLRARSDKKNRALRLGWKVANNKNITTIDIYRSEVYDGQYVKIASVSPTDTSYFDRLVKPITTYYYSLTINGTYETSPPSARVPGILEAVDENLFPPDNVQLKQDSNKVILTWDRNEADTRAYIIYRADSRDGVFKQLASPVISTQLHLSYTDVLQVTTNGITYTYAVADENTSYAISPKSRPVYANTYNFAALPIPNKIMVRKTDDNNKLQVFWPDMSAVSSVFMGYAVFKTITVNGKTSTPKQVSARLIPITVNTFIDNDIKTPGIYHYTVRTVGMDKKRMSSASPEGGYTIEEEAGPAQVSNIKLFPSAGSVQISWNNPLGDNLVSIQVMRAPEGKEAQLMATLDAATQAFTDKNVTAGTTYYYTFITKNKNGKTSPVTDPVGVRIK
ncbi:MAG: hypothetical protein M3O71_02900 [Bacteroidota bacterium]|nr:hypothetical protein [Bacteroidota bacterium]